MVGVFGGGPAFGKGRRVKNNIIVAALFLPRHFGQQVKNIGALIVKVGQPVAPAVFGGQLQRKGRNIHRSNLLRPGSCGIQRKGAGVGEAVQYPAAARQPCRRLPVILLVKEKPGFLPLDIVHIVFYPVFGDGHMAGKVGFQSLHRVKALSLLQPLQRPYRHIVALIYRIDGLTVLPQQFYQRPVHHILAALHPQGKHLRHQHVLKAVYRQPGELVGLPENQAAAAVVSRAHHRLAVVQRIAHPPPEKRFIKGIVGVPADDPYPDFGMVIHPAAAQIPPLTAYHIHHVAVLIDALYGRHFLAVHPRMTGLQAALGLRCHSKNRVISCCHSISPIRLKSPYIIAFLPPKSNTCRSPANGL